MGRKKMCGGRQLDDKIRGGWQVVILRGGPSKCFERCIDKED